MPANMTPPEFGATVAHQYISEPIVVEAEPEIVEPEIKPEIVREEKTVRLTISPEVIAEASAPSPKKEEDVIPYKL
jgi:hypothetical protein